VKTVGATTLDAHEASMTIVETLAQTKIASANQRRRFAQKTAFGECRSDAKPVSMKIFSLPKIATQSPRSTD
jgi:hypothetical protein